MAARANSMPTGKEGSPRALKRTLLGGVALALFGASAVLAWYVRAHWGRPQPPVLSKSAPPASAMTDEAKRGHLLYQANCQNCHGAEGHGDGSASVGMKPAPRDFAAATWKFGAANDLVRRIIHDGSAGTAMPSFALLPAGDLDALTAFVVALAPPEAKETPTLPTEAAARLRQLGFAPEARPRFAAELSLHDLDGLSLSLERWRGKVVLLNFWGTTCTACLRELPELEKLSAEVGDHFAVVSVCFDETDTVVLRKLVQGRLKEMPVYLNPDGLARARYDVQTMPSLFIVDPAGRLVGHATGARSWKVADLRELVRVLKE